MDTLKRRDFVRIAGLTGSGLLAAPALHGFSFSQAPSGSESWRIHFFSKHLQFLDYAEAADACVKAGMDGADLTVRPGGHVLPENVERGLPKAVKAFKDAGVTVEMMASGITDPDDPLTDKVLRTASEQGIKYYRLGYYRYDHSKSMVNNLESFKIQMNGLARLNEKYQINGAYQNHAGSNFGAPVWDLWTVLKDLDPQWSGCQYDIRHATAEGNRAWPLGLRLLKDYIRCIVIKDFEWGERDGRAREINVPVGEGIVDFKAYFALLKELGIQDLPITIHLEYPMFPEEDMSIDRQKEQAIKLMKKDLNALKTYL